MVDEPMKHHRHRDKQAKRRSGRRRRKALELVRVVDIETRLSEARAQIEERSVST